MKWWWNIHGITLETHTVNLCSAIILLYKTDCTTSIKKIHYKHSVNLFSVIILLYKTDCATSIKKIQQFFHVSGVDFRFRTSTNVHIVPILEALYLLFFFSTGKLTKFFQALRTAWVGALLGLGAASLGLEHDFFHSLIL